MISTPKTRPLGFVRVTATYRFIIGQERPYNDRVYFLRLT